MYSIKEDTILEINGKEIDFKQDINNVFESKGLLIAHIYKSYEKYGHEGPDEPMNNVYAINKKGEIVWNIKDIFQRDEQIVSLKQNENGDIVVTDFGGVAFIIDVINKTIIDHYITK